MSRDYKPRSIEAARGALRAACQGEFRMSVPVQSDSDHDCILSDVITELEFSRNRIRELESSDSEARRASDDQGMIARADAQLEEVRRRIKVLLDRWRFLDPNSTELDHLRYLHRFESDLLRLYPCPGSRMAKSETSNDR